MTFMSLAEDKTQRQLVRKAKGQQNEALQAFVAKKEYGISSMLRVYGRRVEKEIKRALQ